MSEPVIYRSNQDGHFWFGMMSLVFAGIAAWTLGQDIVSEGWQGLWGADETLKRNLGSIARIPCVPLFLFGTYFSFSEFVALETGRRFLAIHDDRVEEVWPNQVKTYAFADMSETWLVGARFPKHVAFRVSGAGQGDQRSKSHVLRGTYARNAQMLSDEINHRRDQYRKLNALPVA